MKNKSMEKIDYILTAALEAFLQYGFKKTSMDDIAKAAGITRQGLYFHFKNKDEIFAASIQKALHDGLQAASAALKENGAPLERKLFRALDAWYGSYAGLFGSERSDWDFHCRRVCGSDIADSETLFRQKLTETIFACTDKPPVQAHAQTIAEVLCTCGQSWKRTADSHEKFTEKMYGAIRLCCQNS